MIKYVSFVNLVFSTIFAKVLHTIMFFSFENEPHRRVVSKFLTLSSISLALTLSNSERMSNFLMNNKPVQERKCTSKPVGRYQKAFYFVDNLHENVLRNVYSLDLNYDMELKIQARVHSGKLRITLKCPSTKFVSFKIFKSWSLIALLRRLETPAGHISH